MPHFDSSINLGTLIALGVLLTTFYKAHTANLKRFAQLEFRSGLMWKAFQKRFNITEEQVRQEN